MRFYLLFLCLSSLSLIASPKRGVGGALQKYCAPCHGPDLQGTGGVFPNLLSSKKVLEGDRSALVDFVISGSPADSKSVAKMPPRAGFPDLSDAEIKKMVKDLVRLAKRNSRKGKSRNKAQKEKFPQAYGPLVSTAIDLGKDLADTHYLVARAHIVPLGVKRSAAVVFDSDTMSYTAAWLNSEKLEKRGMPFADAHGVPGMKYQGKFLFQTGIRPGWAKNEKLTEPRGRTYEGFPPLGPLPKDWAHFKGHYLHGNKVIFSYSVGKSQVLDMPDLVESENIQLFTRTLQLQGESSTTLVLAEADSAHFTEGVLTVETKGGKSHFALIDSPEEAKLTFTGRLVLLHLPESAQHVKIACWQGAILPLQNLKAMVGAAEDLEKFTQGGAPQWGAPIPVQSTLASDDAAYVVDRIGIPRGNKWEPRMRIGGFDFFDDGETAAVCTWDGDVWLVSGIDSKLDDVRWKRFATGLHEPLGLTVKNNTVYVVGDNQITRLHDLNKDGEADFYENFNNDWQLTEGFHAFCFDLQQGPDGWFYFSMGTPVRPGGRGFERMGEQHGAIVRVSPDGQKLEKYATGFRAPNGIAISPQGQVVCSDNEGSFVPAVPLHWVQPGKFHGVVDSFDGKEKLQTEAIGGYNLPNENWRKMIAKFDEIIREKKVNSAEMPKPLLWMSKKRKVDNSGGGQVWTPVDKWGPLQSSLLHLSYGQSCAFLVLPEDKGGLMQGGVYRLPLQFTSSAMRGRLNRKDGQLYIAGLKGWQTNALQDSGLDRIRYTGKTACFPLRLQTAPEKIQITFSQPLNRLIAEDVKNYEVKAWNLTWSQKYGSAEKALPGFAIDRVELLKDGKTVCLYIADLRPAHLMEIHFDVKTVEGRPLKGKIDNTIHRLK